jgi:hypothetical protein
MDPEVEVQQQMQQFMEHQQQLHAHEQQQQQQQYAHEQQQQHAQMEQLQNNANHWQAEAAQAQAAAAGAAAAAAFVQGPAAPAAAPHEGMPRGYRPEGLPKYHGQTGEDVEAWLFQIEESNRLFPITDERQRIRYVALALRDTASRWYAAMQMSDPPQITDWESFVTKLKQQFVHLDQKWVARNQLHALRQTGNVRDYTVKFRNLQIRIPDMSVADALDMYIRGLKDLTFKVWRKKFDTLEEAMLYAEERDLEVLQKLVLTKGSNSFGREASYATFTRDKPHVKVSDFQPAPRIPWQPQQEPRNLHWEGPTPMELGVLRNNPPHMNETERAQHLQMDQHCRMRQENEIRRR